jgi:glycosyltransferase involved in cell wall biosynthesis
MIPAGVPDPLPALTGGDTFREKFGLQGKKLMTLFGYTSPNKGYEVVFDALLLLDPAVTFVIAGSPRNQDQEGFVSSLKEQIATRGLQDRVVYTGYLADEHVAEAMAASELVLTPHTLATGSYSVMIPLTYGKPVVASDLAIFREIHDRGGGIVLFPNRDSVTFARTINDLLSDDARRAELSRKALAYSRAHSWSEIARRTVEVYRLAIGDSTVPIHL